MSATEYIVLVDENDQEIGVEEKLTAHQKGLLHRAFSVFVVRRALELQVLLQRRAYIKYHSPGLWTNTCCSHPRPSETILEAASRRLKEEFGFVVPLKNIGKFHYIAHFPNGLCENEIDHVLIGEIETEEEIKPNPNEIQEYRWISIADLQIELNAKEAHFTPWFAKALSIVINHLV